MANGAMLTVVVVVLVTTGAALTVKENARVAVAPLESVTRNVTLDVPAVVGVPLMAPVVLLSDKPDGSTPAASLQV